MKGKKNGIRDGKKGRPGTKGRVSEEEYRNVDGYGRRKVKTGRVEGKSEQGQKGKGMERKEWKGRN